ncbi:nucleotidyltransferase family protein [Thiohalocapsa sp. ML1]|uniref:nucleotidyltransferase family protein n=1 Tax=Thiohalocapsa sp. ML1 TaxID=1431688 RepID=UPI00352821E8
MDLATGFIFPVFPDGTTMLLDEIAAIKPQVLALGERYGARRIRVFGSVARREERPDSDVDFLVDFPRGYDMFGQRLPLTADLADLLHRRVDLVPEHELNRHIRDRVLREAIDL